MSRTGLHQAPSHPSGMPPPGHRHAPLFPAPFHPPSFIINTHYKRCPKAHRLRLRSDQSPSRPLYGRSPDKSRHALSKGHCQVRAPLTRRIRFASSGDALEHSVMSPPWAIAPCSDSPGLDLAGESEQSDERRLKTNAPFLDSAVAALAGQSEQSDERRLKTNAPFTDSTVVTIGELRSTNAGHGSTLPSLRVVERFWWSRPPHREPIARLHHIFSEARGCRKAGFDVEHPLSRTSPIGTGVAAFLRNRPGPSITLSSPTPLTIPMPREESRICPLTSLTPNTLPSPRGACPPEADHPQPRCGASHAVEDPPRAGGSRSASGGGPHPTIPSHQSPPTTLCRHPLLKMPPPFQFFPAGVIQSKQLRIQSTINHPSIKSNQLPINLNQLTIKSNHSSITTWTPTSPAPLAPSSPHPR